MPLFDEVDSCCAVYSPVDHRVQLVILCIVPKWIVVTCGGENGAIVKLCGVGINSQGVTYEDGVIASLVVCFSDKVGRLSATPVKHGCKVENDAARVDSKTLQVILYHKRP